MERLYRETYRRIFGTLITLVRDRATAEDCAQETFERAYRGWASWRPDAPVEAAAPKHLQAVLGRSGQKMVGRAGLGVMACCI